MGKFIKGGRNELTEVKTSHKESLRLTTDLGKVENTKEGGKWHREIQN